MPFLPIFVKLCFFLALVVLESFFRLACAPHSSLSDGIDGSAWFTAMQSTFDRISVWAQKDKHHPVALPLLTSTPVRSDTLSHARFLFVWRCACSWCFCLAVERFLVISLRYHWGARCLVRGRERVFSVALPHAVGVLAAAALALALHRAGLVCPALPGHHVPTVWFLIVNCFALR